MPGRQLGDAYITISPDTRLFGTMTESQVRKAISGINPNVRIGADTKGATAALEAFKARLKALSDSLGQLRLDIKDDKAGSARVTALQAKVLTLAKSMASMTMRADTKKLDAQITAKIAQVKGLKLQLGSLKADADTKAAAAKIAALEAEAFHLQDALNKGKLKADVDITKAETRLEAIDAELRLLQSNAKAVKLGADSAALQSAIKLAKAELAGLRKQAADISLGANVDPAKMAAAEATLLGYEAALEKLAPAAQTGDAALGVLGKALVGTGTGWGFLTRSVVLFGGMFNRVLPVVAASVAVWHVLADAIIEIGAVWIPATLAVGAFAFAASDAAVEVQRRMQAMHTELDATGRSIPGLTTGMEQLHKAVRPEVYQLFGDAIAIMKSRTGEFASVAQGTGTVIDQLAARVTYAITANKQFGSFMKSAVTDVSKLGDSIGNVFGIFGNFFKVIPGFATGLLTIGDDFTKILETASAAAEPLIKWVLLLHGYILYTGLAVTGTLAFIGAMANLAKQFVTFAAGSVLAGVGALKSFGSTLVTIGLNIAAWGEGILKAEGAAAKFGAALAPLASNPMLWVAAAALALGALVFEIVRSKDAAQQFNDTMQQTIKNASLSSVVTTIQTAQAATTAKLAESTAKLNEAIKTNTVVNAGRAGALNSNGTAIQNLGNATRQYQGGLTQLDSQQKLVLGRFDSLSKTYGSNAAALGILNAAGITTAQITDTNSQHWAEALIQIDSTTKAYQAMGTQAGTLGNDLDVLGRTLTDQYKAVQTLNQGWSAFITDVTGTQGSFDTVAQGFATLNDHSGTLRLTLGKLKVSYKDANVAIDSLTPAGIALNQAFGDQIQNVDKLFASWRTAGLAGNLFTDGVKAAIAPMLKYANGSQEATAQLVALAQEAGYQGPISMAALTKWLGNTHGATQRLKDITNQATIQEALLTGAMQSQADFITTQLSRDLNQAILAYNGVETAVKAYGTAVARSGKDSQDAKNKLSAAVGAIVKSELAMGDNAQQMAAVVAKTFGISMPQAFGLVKQSLGDLADKTLPGVKSQFRTFAEVGLNDTKKQSDDLWNQLATKLGPKLDAMGDLAQGPAKKKFIDWAENGLHLSQQKAQDLWKELVTLQQHIDGLHGKNITLEMIATGTGGVKVTASQQGIAAKLISLNKLGLYGGGFINMGSGPTADDVPAMLSRGELVVPANMVASGAVDHLRGRLPGFAAGGSVGGKGVAGLQTLAAVPAALQDATGTAVSQDAQAALADDLSQTLKAMIAQIKAGDGPAVLQYAESFLHKVPYVWGGSTPSGWDCSGFVSYVYDHFGLFHGRTDAAGLQSWARASAPTPGGMAFYGTPAHHVGFVVNANTLLSALGTKWGTTESALNMGDNSGYGVPPQGFGTAGSLGGGGSLPIGKLQELAYSLLNQYGWGGQWNSFNALETREAGWSMTARNPSSGAYGLAQFINGPSEYYQYGGDPNTGLGQLTAMFNYIASRYGSPVAAWAHEVSAGWYKHGGLVGMAGGGLIPLGKYLPQLKKAQSNEYGDYAGLRKSYLDDIAHARKGSWTSGHKAGIRSELATLAARQSAEEAAYDNILHNGTSKANLAKFASRVKAVTTTSRDKDLTHSHPGFTHGLQYWLGVLTHLSQANVAPVYGGTQAKLQFPAWLAKVKTDQSHEVADYRGLEAAFATGLKHASHGSWLYKNRKAIGERLYAVAVKQNAEAAAYSDLVKHSTGSISDLTGLPGRIGKLGSQATAESASLQPSLLGHLPGGHPGWVKALQAQLKALSSLAAATPYNPAWTPANLGPSHSAPGGVLKFDTGRGVLAPGMNFAWNGTGRPEALSASGAGGEGGIHLHIHNSGVIASQQQTDAWMQASLNRMARSGYLAQAVKRAGGH